MINQHIVLLLLIFLLPIKTKTISSLIIRSNQQPSSQYQLYIQNTNDYLDIRSNANLEDVGEEGQKWLSLIPNRTCYLLQINQQRWVGYRYFKNPIHYKTANYNYSLYHSLIKDLLTLHSLQVNFNFQDKYSIQLHYDLQQQKWKALQISIQYIYHSIEKVEVNSQFFSSQELYNEVNSKSFAFRTLTGKGLHQKINLTLDLDMQTSLQVDPLSCEVVVDQILPQSTYIDVDQLRTVKRFELINIQKPQHTSKQYFYSYTIPLSKFKSASSRKYSYLYPIHFRYPQPSQLNYTLVALHPADHIRLSCKNGTKTSLIEQDPFHNKGHASIFNGSSQDTKIVTMITFILTIIGSMIIIKQLRKP